MALDEDGLVVVDEYQRTIGATASSRSATCARTYLLKHVANHEARVVRHNLLPTRTTRARSRPITASSRARCSPIPQIASVGLTEDEARARDRRTSP